MRSVRLLEIGTGAILALVVVLVGIVSSRRETARRVDEYRRWANTERETVFTVTTAPITAFLSSVLSITVAD